jgi:hypothetical protein
MSSRWSEGLRTALTLRLGLWYAGLFALSAAVLLSFTYLLLGRALAAQDREVLESMLQRYGVAYQRSGLTGLRALVDADESEGRHERLLVRVTNDKAEIVYFAQPPGWSGFDLAALDDRSAPGWIEIDDPSDDSSLEVGTRTLPHGITVQIGRSSRVRDEVLTHFRATWRWRRCAPSRRPPTPSSRRAASTPACRPAAPAIRSIASATASTRCWRGSNASSAACARRSTTSRTICARR